MKNFPILTKEYLEWVTDAKTDDTKNKRISLAIEMIQEGKSRNWKYAGNITSF